MKQMSVEYSSSLKKGKVRVLCMCETEQCKHYIRHGVIRAMFENRRD